MGLNLKINRIIFSTVKKIMNGEMNKIAPQLVRQIAGRAGRSTKDGYVSAFKSDDLEYIKDCLKNGTQYLKEDVNEEPILVTDDYIFKPNEKLIEKACLFPPISIVLKLSEEMKIEFKRNKDNSVTLFEILNLFDNFSSSNNIYFIKNLKKTIKTAKFLQDVKAPINLHYTFVLAPCKSKVFCLEYLKKYFKEFVELDKVEIPQSLLVDRNKYSSRNVPAEEMVELQNMYNCILF